MNKSVIQDFKIAARKKFVNEITYMAGLVSITNKGIAETI